MKAIFVGIFVLLSLVLTVPRVNAQPYFAVYPTEGNVNTDIFLQIRGLPGTGFYEVYYLYIFWDDILLGTFPDNSQTYNHYFDTHFSPPNSGSYSALGNHTVYFEVWNAGRGTMFINATFDFTITEYLPCPEYLAMNATYYELLGNYTNLLANYNSLFVNYTALLADYNSLSTNYNNLFKSYDSLAKHYSSLNSTYDELTDNYGGLQASYDSLKTNFDRLESDYNSLKSNNSNLTTSYDALVGELVSTRNLSYIFITTTLIFVATTVFFAAR
ncbi:MAG TPA: hypothetical protein VJ249_09320 [Candidatus Bathyarchaeia archaeon]|nr:hypothetical protein [Candidatus Bathyarchaeia archaeon]